MVNEKEEEQEGDGSHRVCCCGRDIWAKTIAWIEIIFFSFTTLGLIQLLSTIQSRGEESIMQSIQTSSNPVLAKYHDTSFAGVVILSLLLLILSIGSFTMALYLLNGVKKRNGRHLQAWLVYTGVTLAVFLVLFIDMLDSSSMAIGLVLVVVIVSVTTFSLSIVYTLKSEIEGDGEEKLIKDEDVEKKGEAPCKVKKEKSPPPPPVVHERPKVFCLVKAEPTE